MSIHDRATVATLVKVAADGACGFGIAYVAYFSIRKCAATSSAHGRILQAPSVEPSDLRSIISGGYGPSSSGQTDDDPSSSADAGKLMIVRGTVELKSFVDKGDWKVANLVYKMN